MKKDDKTPPGDDERSETSNSLSPLFVALAGPDKTLPRALVRDAADQLEAMSDGEGAAFKELLDDMVRRLRVAVELMEREDREERARSKRGASKMN